MEAGIVMDPFSGSGTTCLVAKRLGRRFVGSDLDPSSVTEAPPCVGLTVDDPGLLLEVGETQISAYTDGGGLFVRAGPQ